LHGLQIQVINRLCRYIHCSKRSYEVPNTDTATPHLSPTASKMRDRCSVVDAGCSVSLPFVDSVAICDKFVFVICTGTCNYQIAVPMSDRYYSENSTVPEKLKLLPTAVPVLDIRVRVLYRYSVSST
jgi:hypothetical protein